MNEIKVFCPASVANVSCGFDLMGFALKEVGDEMIVRKTEKKGVHISKITNYDLPYQAEENVAGKAALEMLKKLGNPSGLEIEIYKNIHPGSGIGSSSASASGAVYAVNQLFDSPFSERECLQFAMEGEYIASQCYHADNVAPALLGGMLFIRAYQPIDYFCLPVPSDLYCTIISPQIVIKTQEARKVLREQVPFTEAVEQCGNLGGLISGLFMSDYELIGRSLNDVLVEPQRAQLIPFFSDLKTQGKEAGALGVGISGSGPSVFALTKGKYKAKQVAKAFENVYANSGMDYKIYVSEIPKKGCFEMI